MVRKTEIFFNHEIEDKVLKAALIMQFETLLSLKLLSKIGAAGNSIEVAKGEEEERKPRLSFSNIKTCTFFGCNNSNSRRRRSN